MSRGPARTRVLLGLSFLGFVGIGLPDGLLGVTWPSIRASFGLPLDALGALLITATSGYVASSFASGPLVARLGVGTLLAASCLLTAASLVGYAVAPAWPVMVALGVLAGLGAGAIDAGLNAHVASHHSARTLSLLHAFYGVGTTAGPAIMTTLLMAGHAWQWGYAVVGLTQLVLAGCFAATRRLWPGRDRAAATETSPARIGSTIRLRAAPLGMTAFFLYCGLEATAGAWIFSLLHEARGLSPAAAGTAAGVYWGGLTVGRLLFGLGPRAHPDALIRASIVATALAATMLALGLGEAADMVAVASLGCACGPVFPGLIAMTPYRLGRAHTSNAVGVQVAAAAVGQSLLPASVGVLADAMGLGAVPLALLALSLGLMLVHRVLAASPGPAV